ncbi:MAG: LysE family transporter [Anaerolineae bacterium]|nr:LysE family transporter [Anaerolineae bacterium]
MALWTLFLQGLGLGFSAAVSPGPFQAFLLGQSGRRSIWRNLPLALAPLCSDGPIILLLVLVLTRAPDFLINSLRLLGGFFLLYLAWGAFSVARHAGQAVVSSFDSNGGFWKAVLMNALSPGPYLFWGTVGVPLLMQSWQQSVLAALCFLAAFYLTLLSCFAAFIVLFSLAHRLDARMTAVLNGVSALALFFLGIYQLWQGINGLWG